MRASPCEKVLAAGGAKGGFSVVSPKGGFSVVSPKGGFSVVSPKGGFSVVSPTGGDVVGKKPVFTQGVETIKLETDI
jgi:hypothetical protein